MDNPPRNVLAAGITEAALQEAITRSGYPLQTQVAEKLSSQFHVQEEWSYRDRDSSGLRTLDVLASRILCDIEAHQPRARPELNLLIECKRSELPFVFFATRHRPDLENFPMIAGLRANNLHVFTDDDLSTWSLPILHALELDKHPFLTDVPISSTFSKCARRSGGAVELSGEESYNGIVLPLIKAAAHFEQAQAPRPTFHYFDAHISIPVAVLDAPMVLVETSNQQPSSRLVPWVRVARHEYDGDSKDWRKDRRWAIDVVHIDYLETYVAQHVQPFAEAFGRLAITHQEELATGEGYVTGLGKNSFDNLEPRLRPRPVARCGHATAWPAGEHTPRGVPLHGVPANADVEWLLLCSATGSSWPRTDDPLSTDAPCSVMVTVPAH
ncbi:hypothetical protein BBAD15_g12556 [Beauveria bassiana D1-5]|uniref:Uncharacterized protein n=1 Tax=Beauveria bassiana D1-5 TaxID=1245745 RepID=A0A0A2V826_BEABA|nr:hypothetical protein BBAD15_g12556 [Beauveria bassiana D1-5]